MASKNYFSGQDVGLTKGQSRWLGGGLILLGLLFATPPGILPLPDDLLNIFVSSWLVQTFTLPALTALVITYTLLPALLLIAGIYIYPERNGILISKLVNKGKRFLNKRKKEIKKEPLLIILYVVAFYVVWHLYEAFLQKVL